MCCDTQGMSNCLERARHVRDLCLWCCAKRQRPYAKVTLGGAATEIPSACDDLKSRERAWYSGVAHRIRSVDFGIGRQVENTCRIRASWLDKRFSSGRFVT